MNVLEKILKEIKEAKKKWDEGVSTEYEKNVCQGIEIAEEIIEERLKYSGWIPVSERLPEEHDSMFAKFKKLGYWRDIMFEKNSDKVNVTIELKDGTRRAETSYTCDGKWNIEKEDFVNKVIAWMPLPEAYKGE